MAVKGGGSPGGAKARRRPRPRRAPVVQPGPIRQTERARVERFKRTPKYRTSVRAAQQTRTRVERQARVKRAAAKPRPSTEDRVALTEDRRQKRRQRVLAEGRARSPIFTDAERRHVSAFYDTDTFKNALLDATPKRKRADLGLRLNYKSPRAKKEGLDTLAAASIGSKRSEAKRANVNAGVVKILDETLRGVRASAGATRELAKGDPQDVPGAILKGLVKNKGPLYGDVLREDVGLPKGVAGPAGFVADVALDPITYLSVGTVPAARVAARSAAKNAAKAGMSKAGQENVARAAAKRAGDDRGLSVRFAGREVPGVNRATTAANRRVKRAAASAAEKPGVRRVALKARSARAGAKAAARDVRPQLRPVGAGRLEHETARQSARRARAATTQNAAKVEREARDLATRIGPANYEKVIDAIERGKIGSLPSELRKPARDIRDRLRYAQRIRRRSGLKEGSIRNYFPHAQEEALLKGLGIVKDEASNIARGRVLQPGSSKKRELKLPISEANAKLAAEGKGKFSTDAPLVYLNYMDETGKLASRTKLANELAKAGRPVRFSTRFKTTKNGKRKALRVPKPIDLKPEEAIFHLGYKGGVRDLRKLTTKEQAQLLKGKSKPGQYVVLNERVYKNTLQSAAVKQSESPLGRTFDKTTGAWKRIATATPGFHARNMIGDTQMAYLGQPARKLLGNVKAGGTALRVASREERNPFDRVPSNKTVKVKGKDIPAEQFVKMAREQGVIRSGYIGRELEDLAGRNVKAAKKISGGGVGKRFSTGLQRAMANREDLMRLATFKSGLDDGLSPAKAADKAMDFHIDYGDLTEFERKVGRRAAPFYTFSARALPLHAKALVQTPGKFAVYEKARQELATTFGFDDDWQEGLQVFQKRQAPIPVKVGGKNYVLSGALPLTLLNEFPTSMDPTEFLGEIGQYGLGMLNPIAKMPVELLANKNMFLRRDIENEQRPLVSAPEWVRYLPESLKEAWGVTEDFTDPRSGGKGLGWNGKPDYIARSMPGVFAFANGLMTEKPNTRGQNAEQKAAGFVTGVRSEPYDPVTAAMSALWERHKEVVKKRAALRQQNRTNEDPKYLEADARVRLVEWQLRSLSQQHGDKIPYFETAKAPGKNDKKIRALEAKAERLAKPLQDRAKKGETVYATPELQKTRDEIRRLRGKPKPASRVKPLPLTPEQESQRELEDFRQSQSPAVVQEELRREIEAFRQKRR